MTVYFFNFSPSSHFYPLQVENCGSNSRLVVDEDDNGKFRLERVKPFYVALSLNKIRIFVMSFYKTPTENSIVLSIL